MPSRKALNFRILAILILSFSLIGLINIPTSANAANPPLSYDNTAFVNTSITYYSLNSNLSGNFALYPQENLTPSQWYFSNATVNSLLDLGGFRYSEGTSVGYNPAEGLDLGIEYYIYNTSRSFSFSGAVVYIYLNNFSNNKTVGTFSWASPTSGNAGNYVELSPIWKPNVVSGYYNIFLNVSIQNYSNVTFTNLSTFQNFDSLSRNSPTQEVPGLANSLIGWTYTGDSTSIALPYPNSTEAFNFSYFSSYPVSFDLEPKSAKSSVIYAFSLPSNGTFYVLGDPNVPEISISWNIGDIVMVSYTRESFNSTAKIVYLDGSFDANYDFTITTDGNWLNGNNVDDYSWDTVLNVSASHLLNTGTFYGSNYNAFYINGKLSRSVEDYQSINTTYLISSGSQSGPFTFTIVTNDYTDLTPSGDISGNFSSLVVGIVSGISAGALATAVSFLIVRRNKR